MRSLTLVAADPSKALVGSSRINKPLPLVPAPVCVRVREVLE